MSFVVVGHDNNGVHLGISYTTSWITPHQDQPTHKKQMNFECSMFLRDSISSSEFVGVEEAVLSKKLYHRISLPLRVGGGHSPPAVCSGV